MPQFACPECGSDVAAAGEQLSCPGCGAGYGRRDGIWRFLGASREAALVPFLAQYCDVREREGRRSLSDAEVRSLPGVAPGSPHAHEWSIRRETYHHLLRHVLAPGRQPSAILDAGAGNGWLSNRLSALGHHVVAADVSDDDADGLGVVQKYPTSIVAVQADFDALPFARPQFDVVLFNGSLHYASNPEATLAHVRRLLRADGTLVVMDSPMFHADVDGVAMIAETVRRFADAFGLHNTIRQGRGYLTFALLAETANAMRLEARFVPSRGPLAWRLRRQVSRWRWRRQPAAFGLWVAR
jgi:SAM-dependent methyltransferase